MAGSWTKSQKRELLSIHKCCITAICWTVSQPIFSSIAMPGVKGHKMKKLQKVAACVNREKKNTGVPEMLSLELTGTMCE